MTGKFFVEDGTQVSRFWTQCQHPEGWGTAGRTGVALGKIPDTFVLNKLILFMRKQETQGLQGEEDWPPAPQEVF